MRTHVPIPLMRLPTGSSSRLIRPSTSTLLTFRAASTSAPSPPPIQPTTFDGKSSPKASIYSQSPEDIRGIPPISKSPITKSSSSTSPGSKSEHAFAGPSRPRLIYDRPGGRDLPKLKSRVPFILALGLLGVGWGLFILQATNSERLASSVLRQVTFGLRNSKEVAAVLGEGVHLAPNWWGFGEPWISGTVNLMQGRVDLSFRIVGSRGAGTVYFTSIRPQQEGAWRIVRYKVIADDGEVIRLEEGIAEGKK